MTALRGSLTFTSAWVSYLALPANTHKDVLIVEFYYIGSCKTTKLPLVELHRRREYLLHSAYVAVLCWPRQWQGMGQFRQDTRYKRPSSLFKPSILIVAHLRFLSTRVECTLFCLPDIPAAQELNIQSEANLNEILVCVCYQEKPIVICSTPCPPRLIESNLNIVEAKHRGDFGNGVAQMLSYLCELPYTLFMLISSRLTSCIAMIVSARVEAKKLTY